MRRSILSHLFSIASVLFAVVAMAQDEEPPAEDPRAADLAKIEMAVKAYAEAFNAKDVDKLLGLWMPDGVYVSDSSGDQLSGKDELKKEFESIFANESAPKLALETDSIEFVSPNVAVERGIALISRGEEEEMTRYRAVYIEDDGNWLIDRVTEEVVVEEPTHYEQLKELEFLVGQWVTEGDGTVIELECQWTTKMNYLSQKYRVLREDEIESSGLRIIGWDAKENRIRSWLFDSNGGFINGKWEKRDNGWAIHSVATLADGGTASSTTIVTPVDENAFQWRKTNRVLDGQLLPNTEQTLVERR